MQRVVTAKEAVRGVYPRVYPSTGQPAGVVVDSRSVTRTRGSIPVLRPAGVLQVRGVSRVRVRVGHLTPAG